MDMQRPVGPTVRLLATGAGLMAGAYAALVAVGWRRYGHPPDVDGDARDELLDRFMPLYDVVERHSIRVAAPAAVTLAAAVEQDLFRSMLVRAIFRTRELVLGTTPDDRARPLGLLSAVQSLGWGVLAETSGREVVVGAITKPWEANVTFDSLPSNHFAAYATPGFVKIAWTLRADPVDETHSVFRTETRAVATDPAARVRFRRYWAFISPGVAAIRWLSLRPLKRDAERRVAVTLGRRSTGPVSW